MKKLTLILLPLAFVSCVKEPTACIDITPSDEVTVFDEVSLTSCSEEAEFVQWEVEEIQNGTLTSYYYGEESLTFVWDDPGTFDIYLTASSKEFKKEDFASAQMTVVDVCYECDNGNNTSEICYGDYEEKSTFDAALANFEESDFTCNKK